MIRIVTASTALVLCGAAAPVARVGPPLRILVTNDDGVSSAGTDTAGLAAGLKVLTGDIDTTTVTGRLVFGIFATLAEFERDLIHERTMAGWPRPERVAVRAVGRGS